MVAIVSGNSNGLNLSGFTPFGRRGNLGQSSQGTNGEQAYVNIANGNLVLQHSDATGFGRGIDLSLLRTYNSQGTITDDNADSWWINGYRRLSNLTGTVNTAGSTVQRVGSDGSVLTYNYNATAGNYQAATGSGKFDTLSYNATSAQWTWTEAGTQNKEVYGASGANWRLLSQSDAAGNTVTYAYTGNLLTSIKDANGESIELTYSGNNLTQERIKQADGTYVSNTYYRYDSQNRLSQVKVDLSPNDNSIIDGNIYVTSYGYVGTSNLVASVTQTDGSQLNLTYVNVGGVNRVASMTDSLGRVTQFAYDTTNRKTTVTDPLGNATSYYYDTANRFTTVVGPTVGGLVQQVSYQYDAAGNLIKSTDVQGNYTAFTYDAKGNVLTQTDNLGNKVENTYTAANKLLTSTVYRTPANGSVAASAPETTRYVYDAQNNPRFVISAEGRVTENRYDAYGQRIATVAYPAASYALTGLTTAQSPALATMTSWAAAQNQGLTNRADYVYNARGQVSSATTYAAMNADGTGLKNGTETTTTFVYDVSGHLLSSVDGNKKQTSYSYDGLGRVLSTVNALGQATINQYDDANHTLIHKQANGRVDTAIFDSAGELLANIIGGSARTEYRYDGLGRMILSIDPTGNKEFYVYDAAGRMQAQVDGRGQVTQFLYNALGQRVQTVQHSVLLSAAQLTQLQGSVNAAATPTPPVPPATVAKWSNTVTYAVGTQVVYGGKLYQATVASANAEPDGAAGVWAEVPLTGQTRTWSPTLKYALNDLVTYGGAVYKALRVNQNATPNLASSPDWVLVTAAPKTTWTDQSTLWPIVSGDRSSFELYDRAGRLAKTVDPMGHVTERQYDGAGNLVAVIARTNFVNVTTLTKTSTPESVVVAANAADRAVYNYYDLDNRLVASVDGERYVTQYRYDAAGRQTETIRYATPVAGTVVLSPATAVTALVPAANAADQHTYALYDSEGRQIASVDAEGYLTEVAYDANGNRTSTTRYATKTTVAVTPTTTLAALRPAVKSVEDQTVTTVYDALNRVIGSVNAEGAISQYVYDVAGNLIAVTTAAGSADARLNSQRYDALGRLTATLSGVGSALLVPGQTPAQVDAIWAQYGTTYAYDAAGRRISSTDPNGAKTLFYYDQSGNLTHTINAMGEVQERRYDAFNQLTGTVRYGTRLAVPVTLTGGLVNAALTAAIAGITNGALDSKTAVAYLADGTVAASVDELANLTTYGYNAFGERTTVGITTAPNKTLTQTVSYDHRGLQISSVTDAAGANVAQSSVYDAFGRLVRSVDGNGNVSQVSYDRLGRAVTSTDATSALRRSSYDAFGRTLTQTDALGNVTSYVYNRTARSLTVTTPEGIQYLTTHTLQGQTASVRDGNGNLTSYAYDKDGNLLTTTRADGSTTKASYDRAGRMLQTTDANGKTVSYTYDAANRVLSRVVDAGGLALTTTYKYDAKGQQISVTDPAGIVTQINYDLKGQVVSQVVDPTGINAITRYTYDGRGKQLTVTSPGGQVVQYVYDAIGRRIEEHVDPSGLNLTRRYTYDKDNNVVAAIDPNGNVTRYAYDADNRLVYTVSAAGSVQKNTYDAAGRVTATIAYVAPMNLTGLGNVLTVAQIAAATVATAGQDAVQNRVYDKDNRLRYTIDGLGDVTSYVYDKSGNVIDRVSYAKRIALASWTPGSVPAVVADPAHDQRVQTVYDALNRAVFTVAGNGAVTATKYDNNGNVIDKVAYSKAIPTTTAMTSAAISAAVALVANAAVDQHNRLVYDAANRVSFSANGVGAVTQYVYDKDGRVVKQVSYATAVGATTAPSAVVASANDRVTLYAYDSAGRQVYQVDTLGSVTKLVYDANGNVVQNISYAKAIAAPVTASAAPTVAALAASVVADAANDRSSYQTYDAAGRLVFVVDSLGAVSEVRYDADGHITATVNYAAAITMPLAANFNTASVRALLHPDASKDQLSQRAYDANGRLVFSVDALGFVRRSSYDGLGRVTASTLYAKPIAATVANTVAAITAALVADAADETTQYRYDNAGELVGTTDALGRTEQYTYDGNGNRLSFTNKAGATWTYSYDSAGRLLTEVSPPVPVTGMTTDANGNLVPAAATNVYVTTALTYDALGNLLTRTEAAGRPEARTTVYVYDALGRQTMTIFPPVAVYNAAEDLTANGANGLATRSETTSTLSTQTFYDTLGNAVANRDVAGNYSYKSYDRIGRVAYDIDALGFVTGYQRNAFGQPTTLTRYALAPTISLAAGAARPAATVAAALAPLNHAADRSIVTTFDQLGRALTVTEPASWTSNGVQGSVAAKVTRNSYNALGQLVQTQVLADAVANTWAVTATNYYDRDGQKTLTVNALGYATSQTFDAAGNVTRITEYATALASWNPATATLPAANADDRSVTFAYDKLNRQISMTRVNVQFSDGTTDVAMGTRTRGNVTTTYGYDAVGNRTAVTDALGSTTYTYYDVLGRVRAVALPVRNSSLSAAAVTPLTEFLRDALGNVTVQIDYANSAASATATGYTAGAASADDRKQLSKYDSHGNLVQNTDAAGVNHYTSYDAKGNVRKQWLGVTGNDGAMHTQFSVYQYDALGRRIATITPASTTQLSGTTISVVSQATAGLVQEQSEYNAFGEMVRQGTNGGRQIYYDYDNAGHLWRTNSGDGVDKVFVYNLMGKQTEMFSSAGLVNGVNLGTTPLSAITSAQQAGQLAGMRHTISQVDVLGRVLTLTLPDRSGNKPVIRQTFDRWNNVLTRSNLYAANSVTTFQYNSDNQIIVQKDPDGNGAQSASSPITQTYYDRLGRQIAVRDANGNVTSRAYDRAGNLTQETRADGGVASFYWSTFGQQSGQRDANGNLTTYTLDRLGRVVQTATAAVGKYSVSGNVLSGANQQLITSSAYDQAGRLLWRTTPNGEKTSYDYDLRGNVTMVHLPMGQTQQRAYDVTGRVIGYRDANGKVATWTYDSFGLLTAQRDIGGATYAFVYDAARQLSSQTSSRGQNLTYRYDGAGQQIEVHDVVLDKFVLTSFNAAGQKTREQTIQKDQRYQDSWMAYNAQGLLARVDSPNDGLSVLMDYDKMGNLAHQQTVQTAHGVSIATQTMVIDGVNHTVKQEISAATAKTDNLWYAYDSMQRQLLIEGAADSNAANNANLSTTQGHRETYDKNGNRISDTSYGEALVAQIVNGNTTYVRHTGLITHYYQYDALNRLVATSVASYDSAWNALPAAQATVVDQRFYDGDGHVVQSGAGPLMPAGYRSALALAANADLASDYTTSQKRYDANGRLLAEHMVELNGSLRYDTTYSSYDQEGNPLAYSTLDAAGMRSDVTITLQTLDGYKRQTITNVRTAANGSKTTTSTSYAYDKNGFLTSTTSTAANGATTVRGFVNDAYGNVVQSLENGKTLNHLLSDGHLVDTWSGTSTATPQLMMGAAAATTAKGASGAITAAALSRGAQGGPVAHNAASAPQVARERLTAAAAATSSSGPRVNYFDESGNAIVSVKPGDTLQSLAQAAYGNADLWYLIADANGIATNSDLSALGTIKIPTSSTVTTSSSVTGEITSSTTTVYHSTDGGASGISESDFWNVIPGQPGHGGGGCGGLGKILVAVVAVAVAVVAGPAILAVVGPAFGGGVVGAVAAGAVTGAVASVASQVVGVATGVQDSISWKGVALGAISGGVGAGVSAAVGAATSGSALSNLAGDGVLATAGRAVVSNVVTQGVEVAVGLQDHFDWTSVAAAGVGSAAGSLAGNAVGGALADSNLGVVGTVITNTASGVASGVASTIVRGGHVDVGNILTDAFGNALGNSLGSAINGAINSNPAGDGNNSGGSAGTPDNGGDAGVDTTPGNIDAGNDPVPEVPQVESPTPGVEPGAADGAPEPDNRALLNAAEQAADPGRYTSVDGHGQVARPGDSIAKLLGTSNPQAIGNFMRANGLTNSTIQAGQNYFIPDSIYAYGDSSGLGQNTLNVDNTRLAQLAAQRAAEAAAEAQREANRFSSNLWGNAPAMPAAPNVQMVEQTTYDALGNVTGSEMVPVDNRPTMAYGDQMRNALAATGQIAIGGAKGLVNGVPATLTMIGKGYVYMGAQLGESTGLFSEGTTQRTINALEPVTGRVFDYSNGLQAMGGVAGEMFSPGAYAKGAQLGAAGLRALGPTADAMVYSYLQRTGGILNIVPESGGGPAMSGPVVFRAPPGATAEEIAQVQAYVEGSNAALEAGALSPTGRVSTAGALRSEASAAAAEERARAAAAGTPYTGHAGHVPDTTWTGTAQPHTWLDLLPRVNSSLGGQATRYPVGYRPTEFIFEGP